MVQIIDCNDQHQKEHQQMKRPMAWSPVVEGGNSIRIWYVEKDLLQTSNKTILTKYI